MTRVTRSHVSQQVSQIDGQRHVTGPTATAAVSHAPLHTQPRPYAVSADSNRHPGGHSRTIELLRGRVVQQKRTTGLEERAGSKRARTGNPFSGTGMGALHAVRPLGLNAADVERMRADIARTFPTRLEQLLECDRGRRRGYQARIKWNLPDEHRFMAALFDCTWQACGRLDILVTSDTTDALLQQTLQTAAALAQDAPDGPVARLLADPDQSRLRALVAAPHRFAPRAADTAQIFAQVAHDIAQQSGHAIAAEAMWRLCIDPQIVAMLKERGIDSANPLLGYLFDSQPGYLHGMARGWQCVMQRVKSGEALDAQFLIALNQACTGRDGDNAAEMDDADDEVDEAALERASTGLDADDVEFGLLSGANLSEDGEVVLRETAAELEQHGIVLRIGEGREDAAFAIQFGQRFLTLAREAAEPAQLRAALQHWFAEYEKECNASGADPALADVRLARRLDQTHAFIDGNVRSCHLLLNGLALARGERPFMFADPNWLDGRADVELHQAHARALVDDAVVDSAPSPMSGIKETDGAVHGEVGAADPMPDGMRLPRRKARIEGDFPWPMTAGIRDRLSRDIERATKKIREMAARTTHSGRFLSFARQVIQAKFETLEPGLPHGVRRYAASLPGRDGGAAVEVALLVYVEYGHIADIRVDTQTNRMRIGAYRLPLLHVALSNEPHNWVRDMRIAATDAGYDPELKMGDFVRTVVRQNAGRNDEDTSLPDDVRLYDYRSSKDPGKVVTLVARVVDNEIQAVRLDDADGRLVVTGGNPRMGYVQKLIASGVVYKMSHSCSDTLRQEHTVWLKKLRTAAHRAKYDATKSMLDFARDVVRPNAGRDDSKKPLPPDVRLYDYPSSANPEVTLVARVVDHEIQMVRLDDAAGKGRSEVIAGKKRGDVQRAIAAGKAYEMSRYLSDTLCEKAAKPWVTDLWAAASSVKGPWWLNPTDVVRAVVRPDAGRDDDKNPLPFDVRLYDYPSSANPEITLAARVVDNKIRLVRLDDAAGKGRHEMAVDLSKDVQWLIASGVAYKMSRPCRNSLRYEHIEWMIELRAATSKAGYDPESKMADFVSCVVKPGAGRDDSKNPLPFDVRLYDYPSSANPEVTLAARVVDHEIQMVRLDDAAGKGRSVVIAGGSRRLTNVQWAIDSGAFYKVSIAVSKEIGRKSAKGWAKLLQVAAIDAGYDPKSKIIDFVRAVVKPGAGRDDEKGPLPDDVRLYDYRSSKDPDKVVTLVAYVVDNEIKVVQLDTPAARDAIEELRTGGARQTA
ncbi:Fic family protein [Noviherbaspirillum saxi]|uniref:Fic family protein n=1 Tax=Noviherbaspirillum saxi TaxID=2320863 RepID=A0A3A3FGT2_9BURK|nr:Fic family protein [Noviherbaspirillum saxi]RJF92380.1 Fic family protein [Noviherbaspirillum saxi]